MKLILTVIAQDRPGIVEEIAAVITAHDGNWVESSMSRLGGEFAGIVQIEVQEENEAKLTSELKDLAQKGITIQLKVDHSQENLSGRKAVIKLTGLDHKGIVRDITHHLAELGISIDHLETNIFTASMSGEPMFHAKAEIRIPDDISVDHLINSMEAIANDIMVDIDFEITDE